MPGNMMFEESWRARARGYYSMSGKRYGVVNKSRMDLSNSIPPQLPSSSGPQGPSEAFLPATSVGGPAWLVTYLGI